MTSIRILALAACAALGACATEAAPAPVGEKQYSSIAAPTQPDVATRIRADDAGKTVAVRKGTKIAVELIGVPTAGLVWTTAATPSFLTPAGEASGATSTAQLEPGFAGGSHWEVFFFTVTGVGSGALTLEQRQPFAPEGPPDAVFTVTVTASE